MKTRTSLLFAVAALAAAPAIAQHISFPTDGMQRGYFDRPYLRYEAEPDFCRNNGGTFLMPLDSYSQTPLQAEASRQCALQLLADGDFVEWTASAEADGLTLRFSLPDSADGKGTKCTLALYAGSEKLTDIQLDSFWAWQYSQIAYSQDKYPDNTPSDSKFARMRFDEVNVLLPRAIKAGEVFRLVREDASALPCTVDFVELEKVPAPVEFSQIEGEKVMYDPANGALQTVINANPGKTIYIPAGTYTVPRRLTISAANTRLVGAGMWHTTLYFSADSDNRTTYSQRGIETSASGLVFEGFSMTTLNNKRYYDNKSSYQVGKGFQGSLGTGSVIRDVRVDHFECGAWIADYAGQASNGLLVEHCRFRNNYADGINLCSGTTGATVRHCSFRNNGDDDMAIWSNTHTVSGNLYEYNTAENNWRASSLGVFGGKDNRAHHIYIADALEEGARINGEFENTGFEGTLQYSDITIERCGDRNGTAGEHGGFWGAACPALHIRGGYYNEVKNVNISNIEIINSRWRGIGISSNSGKAVRNLQLDNIHIDGVGEYEYALYVDPSAIGDATYRDVTAENCVEPAIGNGSPRFTLTELPGTGIDLLPADPYGPNQTDPNDPYGPNQPGSARTDTYLLHIGSRPLYLRATPAGPRKILK